jgi:ABC-type Mn2+/Zn2+ transport system permease subunit
MNAVAWLVDPFATTFMQRALISSLAVGIAAPAIGVWAVSRRLVYLTDAMSHAILAGVAGAALLGVSLVVGGIGAGLFMALLVALLVIRVRVPEDSAIGVVGQGLFAIGVIGVGLLGDPRALSHVLFGNPLTVTAGEVAVQVTVAIVIVSAGWFLGPLLRMSTFDGAHAKTVGVRVGLLDTGLIVALALVVVVGLTSVGVLMAITLITAPAVAARLLVPRLSRTVPLASTLGAFAGVAGLLLSYHLALPTGPTIAIVAVAEVAVAALVARPWSGRRVLVEIAQTSQARSSADVP